jgi:hypothetical protein
LNPVLHPRHKLKYFKTVGWEDEWIDAAEQIVRDEFEQKYTNLPDRVDDDDNIVMLSPKKSKVCVHKYPINFTLTYVILGK